MYQFELCRQASKIGTAVMVPAAPLMTEFTIRNSTEERIYDRSYRIRNNKVSPKLVRNTTKCYKPFIMF